MEHHKKTWPDHFEDILRDRKRFDIRLADFDVREGNTIVFEEWDPEKNAYTGRTITKKISYFVKTKELIYWSEEEIQRYGYQIMQLE